jgi:hypothetical protein
MFVGYKVVGEVLRGSDLLRDSRAVFLWAGRSLQQGQNSYRYFAYIYMCVCLCLCLCIQRIREEEDKKTPLPPFFFKLLMKPALFIQWFVRKCMYNLHKLINDIVYRRWFHLLSQTPRPMIL